MRGLYQRGCNPLKRYLTSLLIVGTMLFGPAATATAGHRSPEEIAIDRAKAAIGTPYRWGGASKRGFDCSGLTMWAWEKKANLPHSSYLQHRHTQHIHRKHLRPGDLLFFYHPIHHVAIYLGHGRMIHANHSGGSVRRDHVYWGPFVGGGRP